jgi:hypothetical protein
MISRILLSPAALVVYAAAIGLGLLLFGLAL